ncbi:MAG: A/G-specific adenine glycosylase [Acidobacteria bacterium]|nr:A/G-specific adenine glycosylase [Acidobacteriota bacterium]
MKRLYFRETSPADYLDPRRASVFRRRLLSWYLDNRRALPWRDTPTPYRVWISEIMLQQTQVGTVLPYYNRFLERFPDIPSLARASETDVLQRWAGLGYYGRARRLHQAARILWPARQGKFPEEYEAVLALPGIGPYTAGAICSIAYNQPRPVVDGNIRRVLVRLLGIGGKVRERFFWGQMSALLPPNQASSFNQAMMELGALVCTPHRPQCSSCPVAGVCRALESGNPARIPVKHPRSSRPVHLLVLLLEKDGRILLASSGKPGFIPGAWVLPCRVLADAGSAEGEAARLIREITGRAIRPVPLPQFRHAITHRRITVHLFGSAGEPATVKEEDYRWVDRRRGKERVLSSLFRKALEAGAKAGA